MDVSFKNKKTKKVFASESSLSKEYGNVLGGRVFDLLPSMQKFQCLADVPRRSPFFCHQLKENRDEQFAVRVDNRYRLVFEVGHDPIPRKDDGGIDLEAVTEIVVVEVVDYHRGKRKR